MLRGEHSTAISEDTILAWIRGVPITILSALTAHFSKSRRRDGGAGEAVTRPVVVIRRTARIEIGSPFLRPA
jgi:hypothetical protein